MVTTQAPGSSGGINLASLSREVGGGAGGQIAGPEQIDRLISSAVMAAERFYPAFQLVTWADHTPEAAMKVAIAEAYGRA